MILVAVKSCARDLEAGLHQAIRETWGKDFPGNVDVRFFIGGGLQLGFPYKPDEIILYCPDGYDDLSKKTQGILQYSLINGYEFTFLCDNDTFVIPKLLVGTEFRAYDYSGRFGTNPPIGTTFDYRDCRRIMRIGCHPWASGGVGYFLNRRAAQAIADTVITPTDWAEDLWVGQVIGPHVIAGDMTAADLPNFECQCAWHIKRFDIFEHKFYPEMIREIYERGTPEPWYHEIKKDEAKVLEIQAAQKIPKTRVPSDEELVARQKSANQFRKSRRGLR